jgi:hypothetical protein
VGVARTEWELAKRAEIAACERDLERARAALTDLVGRSHARGHDVDTLEHLGPHSFEISRLRRRCDRLSDELEAIAGEWAA